MFGLRRSLVPFVFALWTLAAGDAEVTCVFMERCVLPCSFQNDSDVIIHWIQTPGNLHVHSYYHTQDQLVQQDQNFRNRTSLFKEQISRGNASLQLTGVQVQDQGRYKCYTSTIREYKDSFTELKLEAPVSKIHIEQVGNRITCSSEGIYPEPEITWSTDPPFTFKNTTRVQQTEQQLYNVSSSLILSDHDPDVDYSCSISTRRETRRATLRRTWNPARVGAMVGGAVVAAAVIWLVLYCKKKRGQIEIDGSDSNLNKTELDRRQTRNEATTQQKHEDLTNATQPLSNKDSGHTSRP